MKKRLMKSEGGWVVEGRNRPRTPWKAIDDTLYSSEEAAIEVHKTAKNREIKPNNSGS
jgi:hypothetical protein